MAGLGLGLGISSGTVSSGDAVTPTPGRNTTFGRLLTQDDDFILTQDGKFLEAHGLTSFIVTQAGDNLVSQDNNQFITA
tara:strand:+ start:237 stop:473 length:237 start_codon:yes stop_codon:yes gene_type:complete